MMIKADTAGKYNFLDDYVLVQLELSSTTIRHMMIDSRLAGEELHCLNQASKKVIKRILLDKLARSMNQG